MGSVDLSAVDPPRWLLAVGPVVVLACAVGTLFLASPFGDRAAIADASSLEVFWSLSVIGFFAGVLPVVIGMLWFPYIRTLDGHLVHGVLALSAGILTFVGVEIVAELFGFVASVETAYLGEAVALVAFLGTFLAMYAVGVWRRRTVAAGGSGDGLHVAYLVAVALGLHSLGEGLAIGSAFALGQDGLLTLLVIGFLLHNVTEGPTIIAAVARDAEAPPIRHFALMGTLAGGTVIVGGWVGSLLVSPIVATVFFAVALGAIAQVILEVAQLVREDAGRVLTRLNAATFALGVGLMFLLEDVIVGGLLL
ncbi:ZIP family metal transporter [Halalkalicoccus sp. NIPERK01]|uniref:ZIP family metal transporter n=1 Tax=Halalkalicoccus sp. NIPERK01 TaxID=3053469 RepID=UPI00256EB5E3|nr:metal cation transporter [Halalkalicoccus sp. NIPERK01]MDL5362085.1 metal cation transporter [Halalkalicoccus sp. NIPERK01]